VDITLIIKAMILGIVEGLTEFLPISSTGHLILAGDALAFPGDLAKTFDIVIQLGAILAVVWLFRADLLARLARLPHDRSEQRFAALVVLACVPASVIGLVFNDLMEQYLFNPFMVALAQIIGAVIILAVDRGEERGETHSLEAVTFQQALAIGVAQVASLWPGMSRSGSSIIGGMLAGLDRTTATRFSFYLAIPIMVSASGYTLVKNLELLHASDALVLAVGFLVSFVVAIIVIQRLLRFVAHNTFAVFAYYRLALGALVLLLWWFGVFPQ
jgi:undecaprenyl-diphosphatase